MPSALENQINRIGDRLEEIWIPREWAKSRQIIITHAIAMRDLIRQVLGQKSVDKFQKPELLDIATRNRLAARLASSAIFKKQMPIAVRALKAELIIQFRTSARNIYRRIHEGIAEAYNKDAPEGIEILSNIRNEDFQKLNTIRYDGLLYGEKVDMLVGDMTRRIRAIVLQQIGDHATMLIAQRMIMERVDGMFASLMRDAESSFRQYMLWVDKIAEMDTNQLRREE